MAVKTKFEVKSFNKGLITEAGPLTFPDNASLIDENFVLLKDGSRKRRLGLGPLGNSFITKNSEVSISASPAISIFMWRAAAPDTDLIVSQIGSKLFFSFNDDIPIPGVASINGGSPYTLPGEHNPTIPIVASSLRGNFVFAYGGGSVVTLKFDPDTFAVSSQEHRIKVRDTFGIDDGYEVDERIFIPTSPPVTLSADEAHHLYNLRNQGWPTEAKIVQNPQGNAVADFDPIIIPYHNPGDPEEFYFASNADVYFYGKASNGEIIDAIGAFSPYTLRKQLFGNTPAPKGKFIIDLFNRSVDRQDYYDENVGPALPSGNAMRTDISEGYISKVASYAGRIFYSVVQESRQGGDIKSPQLGTMIFFSQVVESEDQVAKCYSDADPTSEHIFDTVATDGGFVQIPEAGKILNLAPMGNSLFVVCSNGVWEIHGGDTAFSATNINLTKTTSIGAISSGSVVVSETLITYWAEGGIYMISIDPGSLRGIPTNLTVNTIQSFYESAVSNSLYRQSVTGVHDETGRKLRWLFRLGGELVVWPKKYNRELVFDIDLRAFYVNVLPDTKFTIEGVVARPEVMYIAAEDTGPVVSFAFVAYTDESFRDFENTDAPARLLTGYLTGDAASLDKQLISFIAHFKRTETGFEDLGGGVVDFANPSGCIITPQWEWTNSASAGKWGTPFQAYRLQRPYYPTGPSDPFDYGYTVVTSKNGIRGRGRALSLLFESEPLKDLHILGWGLELRVDEKF